MAYFYPHFKLANIMDVHEVEWDVSSIRELIDKGKSQYGDSFEKLFLDATVTVNGTAINFRKGLCTELKADDKVWCINPGIG